MRANGSVSVMVVDDQAPFRGAAKAVLAATDGFELVGEAESGERAVELAAELEPEMVLMDINMSGISGIEATSQITDQHPDTVVLLISTYQEADLPASARSCGAAGYVHKEDLGPDVLARVWEQRLTG